MAAEAPTLELRHAFGSCCAAGLRESALFADAQGRFVVQPLGRHVAVSPAGGGPASFAAESPRIEALTAVAVSRSQRLLAACGSTCEPRAEVSLYDLARGMVNPLQVVQELGGIAGRISCAAFSADVDARHLCLASAEPELLLVVLDWRRNVVIGRCNLTVPVDKVTFNPLDSSAVCASGAFELGLWRAGAGVLEPPGSFSGLPTEGATYVDHQWFVPGDNSLAACSLEGPAYILDVRYMQVVQRIATPIPTQDSSQAVQYARCITCVPNGLVFGGPQGLMAVWEVADPSPRHRATSVDSLASESASSASTGLADRIRHVGTSATLQFNREVLCLDSADLDNEVQLVAGFGDGGIGVLSLDALRAAPQLGGQAQCSLVASGCHTAPITSLDVAAQRPLAVTACRKDCSVRVWNYIARRCEVCWEFPGEELTGVAVHPLGYLLAVSCSDRLRFMQILAGELKTHRELAVRGIRHVRFTNGGHLLAAVQGKLILVFSARTLSKVATLRGNSSQVVSMAFESDDRHLVTGTDDGGVCAWSTQNWAKVYEYVPTAKSAETLAVGACSGGLACASIQEGTSKCVLRTLRHGVPAEGEEVEASAPLVSLWHHQGPLGAAVLIGTATGSLWASRAPLATQGGVELGLHYGQCTAVCLSADARTVLTAGADGTVFVLQTDLEEESAQFEAAEAGEVVMINRGDIQKRQEELQQLGADSTSLKAQLQEEKEHLQTECQARVAEARRADQSAIRDMRLRYETLQQAATARERESLREMQKQEATHVARADALDNDYGSQIRQEGDRYVVLHKELTQLEQQLTGAREEADDALEQKREARSRDAQRKLAEREAELRKVKELVSFTQERFDAMLDQEAAEQDQEIREIRREHEQEVQDQRAAEYRLKKEQDGLLRSLDVMEKERERIMREQSDASTMQTLLTKETETLQGDVEKLKAEHREREASLKEKEQDINQYKGKVNTLKKFKQVLDFKLREVKLSLQPKDDMIEQLTGQLRELEAEFERQLDVQKEMEAALEQRKAQIASLSQEGGKLRTEVSRKNRAIQLFQDALARLVCEEQDVRKWPHLIKAIYAEHVDRQHLPVDSETLPMKELGKQIELMERKVKTLKKTGDSQEAMSKADKLRKTDENQALILELEELGAERKELQRQVNSLQYRIAEAQHRQEENERRRVLMLATSGSFVSAESGGTAAIADRPKSAGQTRPKRQPTPPAVQTMKGTATVGRPKVPQGQIWKTAGRATKSMEDKKQMQKLLAVADLNQQQLKMQKLEHKLLEDQLERLQMEMKFHRVEEALANVGGNPASAPAGAGMAAARLAQRVNMGVPQFGATGTKPKRPVAPPFVVSPVDKKKRAQAA